MQRKFITNLILLLFLNLLIKPFWILGIDRVVQNQVGAEDYGIYFALFNLSLILNIFLDIGITNFNNRNISQNQQLLSKHLSGIILLKFSLAVFYSLILLIVAFVIGYEQRQITMLILLGFNQFLLSFILYLRSNIAGLQMFRVDSIISVLDRLLMIFICGILIWGGVTDKPFQIEWFVYAQTAGYVLTTLIAFVIVLRKAQFLKLNWNTKFFRVILKRSLPFAFLVLLMSFYNRVDSIMLERMLEDGAEQSGIYAQPFRLLDAANQIAYLFSVLLLPMFSRMLKLREPVWKLAGLAFKLLIGPAFIVVAGCAFYSFEIMSLLYKEHAGESSIIFSVLMGCFIPICTSYVFGTLLTANGNLRQLNWIAGICMVMNIGLNLILIPYYQALGSAIVSLSTQLLNVALQVFIVYQVFNIKPSGKLIATLGFYAGGVVLMGYASTLLPFTWFINFGVMVAGCTALAFATKLISIKAIYRIIKYE